MQLNCNYAYSADSAPLQSSDLRSMIIDYLAGYLSFTLGKASVEPVARALVERYGNIGVIAGASVEELMLVPKMTQNAALSLKLLCYINSRSVTDDFKLGVKHSEEEICGYLLGLCLGLHVETVFAVFIDDEGRVLGCETIGEGIVNYSEIHLRRLLNFSSLYKASGVVIAHNHPKGRAKPSNQDLLATIRLMDVLRGVGVKLIAHYIVSDTECRKIDIG